MIGQLAFGTVSTLVIFMILYTAIALYRAIRSRSRKLRGINFDSNSGSFRIREDGSIGEQYPSGHAGLVSGWWPQDPEGKKS